MAAVYIAGKYLDENLNEAFGDFWRESYGPHVVHVQGALTFQVGGCFFVMVSEYSCTFTKSHVLFTPLELV